MNEEETKTTPEPKTMRKKRPSFQEESHAVSPVIAVILMVAITVVLAATVFILVSDIGKVNKVPFTMGLTSDDANHRATVTSVGSGADWSQVQFQPDAAIRWVLNANAGSGSAAVASGSWTTVTAAATPIKAGDALSVCSQGAIIPNLVLQFRDTQANSILGSVRLSNVPACV